MLMRNAKIIIVDTMSCSSVATLAPKFNTVHKLTTIEYTVYIRYQISDLMDPTTGKNTGYTLFEPVGLYTLAAFQLFLKPTCLQNERQESSSQMEELPSNNFRLKRNSFCVSFIENKSYVSK